MSSNDLWAKPPQNFTQLPRHPTTRYGQNFRDHLARIRLPTFNLNFSFSRSPDSGKYGLKATPMSIGTGLLFVSAASLCVKGETGQQENIFGKVFIRHPTLSTTPVDIAIAKRINGSTTHPGPMRHCDLSQMFIRQVN